MDIPVSQKLVELIERNAAELANNWLADIRKEFSLASYHRFDNVELYNRAYRVYSQLGKWISRETTKEDIARDYMALGAERRKEGFSLSEIIQALILIRRNLWKKILEEGLLDTTLDLYQAIELNNRVTLFFDRAIYYTALGFEEKT
ncbi:MAG: RsbRD N-terminal domain-containing protein [Clostridiales bacterium]|nr:RsbRD N-terminal domain-containing protein [Clostridiales bacterium]